MLKRVEFSVIKVSGEDEHFPAVELNNQRPTAKGWMSPKFCPYPQVIVLRLETRARLCKFQVMSHSSSISSKLELYVGDINKGLPDLLQNVTWEKQGEISFSENSVTSYKARELRSALLDIIAKFVKIVLHQNHVNKINMCNQVGILAINIIGESVLDEGSIKAKHLSEESLLNTRINSFNEVDDLSFNMYVDEEIAQLIRALEKKKQKAVTDDRFVYAKKLKYAVTQLKKIGEKIGKLDIEKDEAVCEEDYDKAHLKKEEIEKLRLKTYERLKISDLLEIDGKTIEENDKHGNFHDDFPEMFIPMVGNYVNQEKNSALLPKKSKKTQPSVFPGSDTEVGNDLILGKLTEKERREASLPIEVFGLSLVEKIYSKLFKQREEAMKELRIFLEKYQKKGKTHAPSDVIKAATFLIQKALYDKVHSIYTSALNILSVCYHSFIPTHQVPKSDAINLTEKSMPEIINKLGDTANRLKAASLDYTVDIISAVDSENLQMIQQHILSPLHNNLNIRLVVGRCQVVEKIVHKYPPWSHNILPYPKLMPFLLDALQHPSSSVRATAEKIVIFLYEHDSNKVGKYFPSDSDVPKRNLTYRRLLQTFDRVNKKKKDPRGNDIQTSKENSKHIKEDKGTAFSNGSEHLLLKTCIFCEKQSDQFTAEGLDEHYDKDCPMLLRCSNCRQIVEIAGLTEHLLDECEAKDNYKQCPICLEAVPSLNFENHVKIRTCVMAKSNKEANHCPLCHMNIEPGEQGWRSHLMGQTGCEFNSRNTNKRNHRKGPLFGGQEPTWGGSKNIIGQATEDGLYSHDWKYQDHTHCSTGTTLGFKSPSYAD